PPAPPPPAPSPAPPTAPPTSAPPDSRPFEAAAAWSTRTVSSHVAHGRPTAEADGWGMTTRIAALLAVAVLVLGVGCGRQTRVSQPSSVPPVATTVAPAP